MCNMQKTEKEANPEERALQEMRLLAPATQGADSQAWGSWGAQRLEVFCRFDADSNWCSQGFTPRHERVSSRITDKGIAGECTKDTGSKEI